MDKKTLIMVIVILLGGMLLGTYSYIFEVPVKHEVSRSFEPPQNTVIRAAQYSGEEGRSSGLMSFSGVVKKIKSSLVNVSAVHIVEVQRPSYRFFFGDPFEDFFDEFFERRPRKREPETEKYRYEGTGSGFIVGPEGYILTNYHVIKDAKEIKVRTHDDKSYDAEIIGQDPRTDLAVVKIKSSRKFNALKMGNSDEVEIGDWVMAAGSPFGLKQTYTVGIISALRQNVRVEGANYENMIQTDAAINRGNSGGPLVDINGSIIGINTAIYAPTGVFSGVGFAIPINKAKNVLSELIEKGKVVRGWLGIEIKEVDEAVKKHFELKTDKGVLVNRVMEDSPAQKGGLKRGDVIVKFNGKEVEGVNELQNMVSSSEPGEKVKVTVIRQGKQETVTIKLGEMPEKGYVSSKQEGKEEKQEKEEKTTRWLGIEVSEITGMVKERYNVSASEGVIVVQIDPTEKGYEIGLQVGDVIKELNKKEINNVEDFKKAVKDASLKDGVVFDIIRNGRPIYISFQKS
ncbi:MAG: Do family serine endopeptidase [Elusimicrobiota bacterium]